MESIPMMTSAPPLDPEWLRHEQAAGLLLSTPSYSNVFERRVAYSQACRDRNTTMLDGRDAHLTIGLITEDSTLPARDGYAIRVRVYTPHSTRQCVGSLLPLIIYYHGGKEIPSRSLLANWRFASPTCLDHVPGCLTR